MNTEDIQTLYKFNEWANDRFIQVIKGLSKEQFTSEIKSSFSSVSDTLGHIVASEWVWLRRWLDENPSSLPDWLDKPDLETLLNKLSEVESERKNFLRGLNDESLQKIISYRNLKGEPHKRILQNLLQHVVNHSTYHRGQLTTLLRQLDSIPPATDFVLFIGENQKR